MTIAIESIISYRFTFFKTNLQRIEWYDTPYLPKKGTSIQLPFIA